MTTGNGGPAPAQDTASVLFGLPGLQVVEAEHEADGTFTVWAVPEAPACCPGCGSLAAGIREHVAAAARDVYCGGRPARLRVHKRRLECGDPACAVATFTEPPPKTYVLVSNREDPDFIERWFATFVAFEQRQTEQEHGRGAMP